MSPPEPINQNSSQQTLQVEELNNLIDKMNIEKSLNKRKVSTPSTEIKNQDESKDITEDTSESARKNKERAAARKSRLNKTQQKGNRQSWIIRIRTITSKKQKTLLTKSRRKYQRNCLIALKMNLSPKEIPHPIYYYTYKLMRTALVYPTYLPQHYLSQQ